MIRELVLAARANYPRLAPGMIKQKIRFLITGIRHRAHIAAFGKRLSVLHQGSNLAFTPRMLGLAEWPYVNNAWNVAQRFDAVAAHYELIQAMPRALRSVNDLTSWTILDLGNVSVGARVTIDRAPWFAREGELVLNLFQHDLRVASIGFLFGSGGDAELAIFVGAVQGIHKGIPSGRSLEIFKGLTKDFEGLRPRSVLIIVLRVLAELLGVRRIFAVADANRHHRHPYFGPQNGQEGLKQSANYDAIWTEHQGVPGAIDGFFELPLEIFQKPQSEIPSNKRAMYRRRGDLIERIRGLVKQSLCAQEGVAS